MLPDFGSLLEGLFFLVISLAVLCLVLVIALFWVLL